MSEKRTIQLPPAAAEFLGRVLHCTPDALEGLTPTDAGMTNRSFRFTYQGKQYMIRVPGEGTDQLINRRQEAACYAALGSSSIPDQVLALDPESGMKLSVYWENTRSCNVDSPEDVKRCMALLRRFHEKKLKTAHSFDLFGQIDFYEALMGHVSEYPDYREVYDRCMAMAPFIRRHSGQQVLSHIDAVSDNFLFVTENGEETLHLIDWEYAGMQDPQLDLAMFAIYTGYNQAQLRQLADWYLDAPCDETTFLKLRCYAALAGLLWSNWCEYKKQLGVTYGDYALMQYHYARDFSRECLDEIIERGELL